MASTEITLTTNPAESTPSSLTATCAHINDITSGAGGDEPLLSTFHWFRKLPIELRLIIWKLSLPPGRVVIFEPAQMFPCLATSLKADYTLPTPLLHVNCESRVTALGIYELCKYSWLTKPIYVNFREDTISLGGTRDLSIVCGCEYTYSVDRKRPKKRGAKFVAKIQHLSLRDSYVTPYSSLRAMGALRTVAIDIDSSFLAWVDRKGRCYTKDLKATSDCRPRIKIIESLTGAKEGLWTGDKKELPILLN